MDNYHIYSEIGRGKGSIVYKGREKKTINYVAIKSVEKQFKNKVLNEVAVLYSLIHPNILRFINWYETSKHIWLIVEYCTGGDLLAMIRLDQTMPEYACKRFAFDILSGLQFIHSKGYIYGDLKPSNILVNEHGTLLLCDFGLAKKVMTEEEYSKQQQHADAAGGGGKRGSPYYMSPELFYSDGIHSFGSDLWAFGCLLYELATGRPPFYAKNLDEVVTSILEAQPRRLWKDGDPEETPRQDPFTTPVPPHTFSRTFQDLLDRCLEKDPGMRITWPELRAHEWWVGEGRMLEELDLPEQPVFKRLFQSQSPQQTNGQQQQQDQHKSSSTNGKDSTLRSSLSQKHPIDVMRLSFQAKKNIEQEKLTLNKQKQQSHQQPPTQQQQGPSHFTQQPQQQQHPNNHHHQPAAAEPDEIEEQLDGTVTLNSYDTELNFSSRAEEDVNVEDVPRMPPATAGTSRPMTSAVAGVGPGTSRMLREPKKPAQPSELDQMEEQLARMKAREEEEEDGDGEHEHDDEDHNYDEDDYDPDPPREREHEHHHHQHDSSHSTRPPHQPKDAFRSSASIARQNQQHHHHSSPHGDDEYDYSDAMALNDAHGHRGFHHAHHAPSGIRGSPEEEAELYAQDEADLEAYPSERFTREHSASSQSGETEFSQHRPQGSAAGAKVSTTNAASTTAHGRKDSTPATPTPLARKSSAGASRLPVLASRNASSTASNSNSGSNTSSNSSTPSGSRKGSTSTTASTSTNSGKSTVSGSSSTTSSARSTSRKGSDSAASSTRSTSRKAPTTPATNTTASSARTARPKSTERGPAASPTPGQARSNKPGTSAGNKTTSNARATHANEAWQEPRR